MSGGELVARLAAALGPKGCLVGDNVTGRYAADWSGMEYRPSVVARPENTAQVATVLELCNEVGQCVVVQGGMTGLVGGAVPQPGEIALSLERLNRIEEIDRLGATMTVEAGAPLESVQEAAAAAELFFPVDIGARGSCQLGGNLAMNAGGNRVLRYGMTRENVLGIEVVLADGTVVSAMNRMLKNNTGYDLKHLFIGSEGTLGVVTRTVLRLHRKPRSRVTALCAFDSFAQVTGLLQALGERLAGELSSFEVMWQDYYRFVVERVPGNVAPLEGVHPLYCLVELLGGDQTRDQEALEALLGEMLERGELADAVLAQSLADASKFWRLRDSSAEAAGVAGSFVAFDVSIPLARMEEFVSRTTAALIAIWGDGICLFYGHMGDCNLHLITTRDPTRPDMKGRICEAVYEDVARMGGSVSAEHGIGIEKRPFLGKSRSAEEIALMRTLKAALDPKGILNPGRIFSVARTQ
ncbi:MAG: FAD-binding oxidoreductase [Proteobacteria bacterium]|nr:FAD-binding oxidoreductase [Pseudomonadota bacterium]